MCSELMIIKNSNCRIGPCYSKITIGDPVIQSSCISFPDLQQEIVYIDVPCLFQFYVLTNIQQENHRTPPGTTLKIPRNSVSIFFLRYVYDDGLP